MQFLIPQEVIAAAGVRPGMQVADFEAGPGFFTRAAARAVGPEGTVWAVGLNRDLLNRVKNTATAEGLHNVEVLHGDIARAQGTHLPTNSTDLVIIATALFAVEHRTACAAEAYRILKSPSTHTLGGAALVIDWKDSFDGLGPHPAHVVTKKAARAAFEAAGFTYIADVPTGDFHWGMILTKKAKQ